MSNSYLPEAPEEALIDEETFFEWHTGQLDLMEEALVAQGKKSSGSAAAASNVLIEAGKLQKIIVNGGYLGESWVGRFFDGGGEDLKDEFYNNDLKRIQKLGHPLVDVMEEIAGKWDANRELHGDIYRKMATAMADFEELEYEDFV